jgi:putative ABC transport system permease protein
VSARGRRSDSDAFCGIGARSSGIGGNHGWAIGYALARLLNVNMAAEVMRSPCVIEPSTYVVTTAIVLADAVLSALVVRGRINRLDLVSVLKARE